MTTLERMQRARQVSPLLAAADSRTKNNALLAMADALQKRQEDILAANREDLDAARGHISEVMLDRLALDAGRIAGMAEGIRQVAALPDPVGEVLARVERPNGLVIEKTAVPLGVIAIIYESRPNVTSDAAALCIKSGNACILRSGKEAWRSAWAITCAMQEGLDTAGLPGDLVQLVQDTTRQSASDLMNGVGYIDLLIPRGGAGLIRACTENAAVHRQAVFRICENADVRNGIFSVRKRQRAGKFHGSRCVSAACERSTGRQDSVRIFRRIQPQPLCIRQKFHVFAGWERVGDVFL